jgi:bacillopeptidase F (M6 metalloprotease family)
LHIDTAETTTTAAYDTLKVQVRNSSGTVLATLAAYSNLNAAAGYSQKSFDLTSYKGQTIQVYLIGVEDSQKQTSFVVDDFALNVTTGSSTELISNNGFEGTLSPWVLGGAKVPIVSTARIHTGADSMRLGATTASGSTEPNGDSSAYQSVTIPANAITATLTFWYSTATTDTIQFDWQEAQIQDSNGATLLQVFKLAANNTAWTQQTVDLKPYAGRTIRIYFNCHGDGATDPTTLWVDDVSVQVTQ